jgi:hypothetical protein
MGQGQRRQLRAVLGAEGRSDANGKGDGHPPGRRDRAEGQGESACRLSYYIHELALGQYFHKD